MPKANTLGRAVSSGTLPQNSVPDLPSSLLKAWNNFDFSCDVFLSDRRLQFKLDRVITYIKKGIDCSKMKSDAKGSLMGRPTLTLRPGESRHNCLRVGYKKYPIYLVWFGFVGNKVSSSSNVTSWPFLFFLIPFRSKIYNIIWRIFPNLLN